MKIINSLFFLFFLGLSAQMGAQTGKTESETPRWILIENQFYRSIPGAVQNKMQSISVVRGIKGMSVLVVDLKPGEILSEDELLQAIPVKDVSGGEGILAHVAQQQEHNKLIVATIGTLGQPVVNVGEKLPELSVMDTQGILWDNERIVGKPTVFNFWHTGCGPCIREMPELNEWMTEVPDVNYLSVTWNTAEQIERIVTETPFLFHHLTGNQQLFQMFAVQITPTTVLLDRQGIVREIVIGTSEEKRAGLLARIRQLTHE